MCILWEAMISSGINLISHVCRSAGATCAESNACGKLIDFITIACDGKFSLTYFLKFSLKPDDSNLSEDQAARALCAAQSLNACGREWKVLDLWDFVIIMSIQHTVKRDGVSRYVKCYI